MTWQGEGLMIWPSAILYILNGINIQMPHLFRLAYLSSLQEMQLSQTHHLDHI